MKGIWKYLLTLALGFGLGVFVSTYNMPEPSVTTETVTDTIYLPKVDSTGIKPIPKVVVENAKPVVITIPNVETTIPTDSVIVATSLYVGEEVLDNGTIGYEIYADNLVATNFTLTTNEKIITNTTTITKILPPRSMLFLSGGTDLGLSTFAPQAVAVGIMYNHRQKWGAGAEIRQDISGVLPINQATTVGLRFYYGLGKKKK